MKKEGNNKENTISTFWLMMIGLAIFICIDGMVAASKARENYTYTAVGLDGVVYENLDYCSCSSASLVCKKGNRTLLVENYEKLEKSEDEQYKSFTERVIDSVQKEILCCLIIKQKVKENIIYV